MKTTIEDGTPVTTAHSGTPLRGAYGPEFDAHLDKVEKEFLDSADPADYLYEIPPLSKPASLESKDQHADTVVDWKHLFKDGESVVLKGVLFVYAGRGKRCLHFRRVK